MSESRVKITVTPRDGETEQQATDRVVEEWTRRTAGKPKRRQSAEEEKSIKKLSDESVKAMQKQLKNLKLK